MYWVLTFGKCGIPGWGYEVVVRLISPVITRMGPETIHFIIEIRNAFVNIHSLAEVAAQLRQPPVLVSVEQFVKPLGRALHRHYLELVLFEVKFGQNS